MRVERAGPQDYIVSKHFGPSRIRFVPTVKLDLSQVRDIRAVTRNKKPSIGSFMRSTIQAARRPETKGVPTTAQLRARNKILRPYRRLKIGSLKMRGGK